MKFSTSVFFALLLSASAFAQDGSETVTLDLLKAPSSPAFNLLGISPSVIERPTDLNSFRVSLQNSSNNFTQFPSDYAVEIAPADFLKTGNQTLEDFKSSDFKKVFLQSLSISTAITHGNLDGISTADSSSFSKAGFGCKFSIVRPNFSKKTSALVDSLIAKQRSILDGLQKAKLQNKDLAKLDSIIRENERDISIDNDRRKFIRDSLTAKRNVLEESIENTADSYVDLDMHLKELEKVAAEFKIERIGAFLDFAAGIALDFPDNRVQYSRINKAGAWLTGGYEGGNNGFTFLGIIRYLYQPDKIFADDNGQLKTDNVSTFDMGARLLLTKMDGRFVLSAESIYRSVLNADVIAPTWRFTFNTEYDIGQNKKLTLALGKNFDGTITKDGNLIAALNFIAGFGGAKRIVADKN